MFSTEVIFSKYFWSTFSWIHRGKTLWYGGMTKYVYIWYKMNLYTSQRGFSLSIRNFFLLQESSSKVLSSHNYSWKTPGSLIENRILTTLEKSELLIFSPVSNEIVSLSARYSGWLTNSSSTTKRQEPPWARRTWQRQAKRIQVLHLRRQMSCSKILSPSSSFLSPPGISFSWVDMDSFHNSH